MLAQPRGTLVIYDDKAILVWLQDAYLQDAAYHIKNGYPSLLKRWEAGELNTVLLDLPANMKTRMDLYTVVNGKVVENPDIILEQAKADKRDEIERKRRASLWTQYDEKDLLERLVLKYGLEFGTFPVTSANLNKAADSFRATVNNAKILDDVTGIKVDFTAKAAEVKT
jgi:hypothetical protein